MASDTPQHREPLARIVGQIIGEHQQGFQPLATPFPLQALRPALVKAGVGPLPVDDRGNASPGERCALLARRLHAETQAARDALARVVGVERAFDLANEVITAAGQLLVADQAQRVTLRETGQTHELFARAISAANRMDGMLGVADDAEVGPMLADNSVQTAQAGPERADGASPMPLSSANRPAVTAALKAFRQVIFESPTGVNNPAARAYAPTLTCGLERLAAALHPSNPTERIDLKADSPGQRLRWPPFMLYNGNEDLYDPAPDLPPEIALVWTEVWNKLVAVCQHSLPLSPPDRIAWLALLDKAARLSDAAVIPHPPDGPFDGDSFAWGRNVCKGLSKLLYDMLVYFWDGGRKMRSATYGELIEHVWGTSENQTGWPAVKSAASRLDTRLNEDGIFLGIHTRAERCVYVEWTPSE